VSRRSYLTSTTAAAALMAASTLPSQAYDDDHDHDDDADEFYGHGMVWNRELPGVAGDLKLSFDLRVNVETGKGFGTAEDPIHPDWNMHFSVDSIEVRKRPKGEKRFTMTGVVTRANNPNNVGQPVKIIAETVGDITAIAIALGDLAFGGAGLVVVASATKLVDLLIKIIFGHYISPGSRHTDGKPCI
jgi:hypothetical protein